MGMCSYLGFQKEKIEQKGRGLYFLIKSNFF